MSEDLRVVCCYVCVRCVSLLLLTGVDFVDEGVEAECDDEAAHDEAEEAQSVDQVGLPLLAQLHRHMGEREGRVRSAAGRNGSSG